MRLAFVLNSLQTGGAETQTVALAAALRSRGHTSLILQLLAGREIPFPEELRVTSIGGNALTDFGAMKRLGSALSAWRADAIVGVNLRPFVYAHLAGAIARLQLPNIAIFHSTLLQNWRERANLALSRPFFARSDALVYVSANQRKYWEGRGLKARRVETIPNGIDTCRFSPAARLLARQRQRRALGYAPSDYVIGMSAAFRPEKNHSQAIEALAALGASGTPAHLLLIGDGPMLEPTRARAEALNVLGSVHFAGRQADVVPWLAAFDVGLLTSRAIETLSLSALETMGMGIPMVMSDIGGASEIISDGISGRLFPAGDTTSLVAALAELQDPELRHRMGRTAAETVATSFEHEHMVDRYEMLLRELTR